MRQFLCLALLALLAACTTPPPAAPKPDVTAEAWYRDAVMRLQEGNRRALEALQRRQRDDASRLILENEKISQRLLGVARPTLEATLAVSDTDRLHARMLTTNKHYGWARLILQKDANRWQHWTPPTEETRRRFREAQEAMAECDRGIATAR